jgi:hypothetical protein
MQSEQNKSIPIKIFVTNRASENNKKIVGILKKHLTNFLDINIIFSYVVVSTPEQQKSLEDIGIKAFPLLSVGNVKIIGGSNIEKYLEQILKIGHVPEYEAFISSQKIEYEDRMLSTLKKNKEGKVIMQEDEDSNMGQAMTERDIQIKMQEYNKKRSESLGKAQSSSTSSKELNERVQNIEVKQRPRSSMAPSQLPTSINKANISVEDRDEMLLRQNLQNGGIRV